MKSKIFQIMLCLALVLAPAGVLAAENSAPLLRQLKAEKLTVTAPDIVEFTMKVNDEEEDANYAQLVFREAKREEEILVSLESSEEEGTLTGSVELEEDQPSGSYVLAEITISDQAGNETYYDFENGTTAFPKSLKGMTLKVNGSGDRAEIDDIRNVSGGVKLTWSKVPKTAKYAVYYRVCDTTKWKRAGVTRGTSITVKNLKTNTAYEFYLACLTGKGKHKEGMDSQVRYDTYVAAPQLVSAKMTDGTVTVTWKEVPESEGYRVYKKTTDDEDWTEAGDTRETSLAVEDLESGKKYYFTVACLNVEGFEVSGRNAKGLSAVFVAPTAQLSVDAPDGKKMEVTWQADEGAGGYQIQYAVSAGFKNAKTVTVKGGDRSEKKITKPSTKKQYYVRIRTYKTIGKKRYYSAWSTSETPV